MAILEYFFHNPIYRWAVVATIVQGFLTLAGFVLILALCIYRSWQQKIDDKMMPQVQDAITAAACGLAVNTSFLKKLPARQKAKGRGMLLTAINGLQGDTREKLAALYDEMEFIFEDYRALKDKNFTVRLGAIARLEAVKDVKAVSLITPLMRDESPYVHFAALIYLLKQKKGFEPRMEAEMELAALLHRYDTAREVLDIYSRTHRARFLNLFAHTKNNRVREVCLDVIQKNRIEEAMPILVDHILEALRSEGYEEYALFDFKRYTLALTISPSALSEDLLLKMTDLQDANVRASAYKALFKMRPDMMFELKDKLAQDTSPQAARIYQNLREEMAKLGAAA